MNSEEKMLKKRWEILIILIQVHNKAPVAVARYDGGTHSTPEYIMRICKDMEKLINMIRRHGVKSMGKLINRLVLDKIAYDNSYQNL